MAPYKDRHGQHIDLWDILLLPLTVPAVMLLVLYGMLDDAIRARLAR